MNLKSLFRPVVLKMRGYTPGEQPKSLSTIKLNTNENPYPPSAPVLKAIKGAAGAYLRRYPQPTADRLREAIAKAYHWPVDGIMVGNGSDEILSILFHASVGKGDLVQFPDVTYSLYVEMAALREAKIREVKLDKDFDLPFEKLSKNARLTLWGHPNPPVGNHFDFAKMKSFCQKAKGLVLIDEAYVEFFGKSCESFARACPNVLLLHTMSKAYSLAGARLGFVMGHPSVIHQLMKVKDSYNVNYLTQAIGLAALSPAGLKEMRRNVRRVQVERNGLIEALRDLGFKVPDSQSNFVLATRPGNPTAESLYKNLKKKRILVRYFSHPRLRHSLRISIGTPQENSRLLAELKKLL